MKKKIKQITVIGDGGWGTTLALCLARKELPVYLWGPFPQYITRLRKNRYNSKFLPGIRLPQPITPTDDLEKACADSELIVFAVPSKFAASILRQMKAAKVDFFNKIILSVTKGIDTKTLQTPSEMIRETFGNIDIAVLSGPTHRQGSGQQDPVECGNRQ